MHKIKLKRGRLANIPRLSLAEPAFTTDSEDLFVGGSSKNIRFVNASKTVTNVYYDSETGNLKKTIDGVDYDAADLHAMAEHDYPGVYSGFITKEASGDIVTIEDGADNVPLKSASFEIKPVQDLHGQASPWPAGATRNKLDIGSSLHEWFQLSQNGTRIASTETSIDTLATGTINPYTGAITITSYNSSGYRWAGKEVFLEQNTNYKILVSGFKVVGFSSLDPNTDGTTLLTNAGTFNTGTYEHIIITFYPDNFSRTEVMILLDTESDTSFIPYSNICPISGFTGAQITRTSANLWDGEYEAGTYDATTGEKSSASANTANRTKNKIKVIPDTSVYHLGGLKRVFYYDENEVYLTNAVTASDEGIISIPYNVHYITFQLNNSYNMGAVGINYPSTVTEYEPFGTVYSVSWADEAGTVYGGQDNVTEGELTPTYDVEDMGDLEWTRSASGLFTTTDLASIAVLPASGQVVADIKSSMYYAITSAAISGSSPNGAMALSSTGTLYVQNTAYSDAATFKTAMAGVQLMYKIKSPQTVQHDPTEITTLLGDNNIFCSIAPLSITYRVNLADSFKAVAQQDGNYPKLVAGLSRNLIGKTYTEDKEPYLFRKAPNAAMVKDAIVGGTVAFNQLVYNGNFADSTGWGTNNSTLTVSGNIGTMLASAQGGRIGGSFNAVSGHKYLLKAELKLTTATESVRFYVGGSSSYVKTAALTGWQILSGVSAPPTTGLNYWLRIVDNRDSGWDEVQIRNICCFDLTQMFGSTVADYIYSLEQATEGAGVAFFRNLFPKSYYDYSAGEPMSVQTSAHKMVGRNLCNWKINTTNADPLEIRLTPNTYRIEASATIASGNWYVRMSDASGEYFANTDMGLDGWSRASSGWAYGGAAATGVTFTVPSGCALVEIGKLNADGTIPAMLSFGPTATPYEPYEELTYPIDPVELRGLFKLDSSNKLYCDGDIYPPSGGVSRRYGLVDLGTPTWTYDSQYTRFFASVLTPTPKSVGNYEIPNALMLNGFSAKTNNEDYAGQFDKSFFFSGTRLYVVDKSYTDAATFKTAISGVYLVYEIATPTTETAEPFAEEQVVYSGGTEEYIDERDVAIPVGHDSKYYKDISLAVDGIPEAPSADGTYTLKVVVTSGKASYSWVSA